MRTLLIWTALILAIGIPISAAALSPLLAWRDPIYIMAGFAGIAAMGLLLVQPLLVAGYLPGLPRLRGRTFHRWCGVMLVASVVLHVAGLWITSPPDVVDALLFASPTPFSAWGVVAMWALFASALIAAFRARLALRPVTWRRAHTALLAVVIVGSIVHAIQIEGTMEPVSKTVLCVLVFAAAVKAVVDLRVWARRASSR